MMQQRYREEVISRSALIPYSRILEGIRSAWQICQPGKPGRKTMPNRFVLLFSPEDRKARAKAEDVFLEEITRDILYIDEKMADHAPLKKIQVQVRTEKRLKPGRFRIECYEDERLLYRFDQDEDSEFRVDNDKPGEEWTAVDILPQEGKVGKCILIVDDEPVLCAVLQRMLTKLDYHVVSAHDGVEATKILSHMNIDLVITDLRMPRMDGWALMKHVKQNYSDIPVILITGYHSIHTESQANEQSADGYISKPFSLAQIKELLDSVLQESDNTNTSITYIEK